MSNETITLRSQEIQGRMTDNDVRDCLLAVGLDEATAVPESYHRAFADLDLDSLARVEIASQIRELYGVEVEPDLTAEATPAQIRDLVNARFVGQD